MKLAPRHHKLLTKELEKRFAQVGRQEGVSDPVVITKFFNPYGRYTFFATEFYPEDRTFYGFCLSNLGADCDEWGYTSLDELETVGVKVGGYLLPLERDCYFTEKKFSEVRK